MTSFSAPLHIALRWRAARLFAATLFLASLPAAAIDSIGVVVDLQGNAEIETQARTTEASVGAPVAVGSRLRTHQRSQVRVALHDGTILQLDAATEVIIERHAFDPTSGRTETDLTLVHGRLQPHVDAKKVAKLRVASATATADTQQGEFVVEYDHSTAVTEVTGIRGDVAVHSVLDPSGSEVLVTARQVTSVRRGALPAPLRHAERMAVPLLGREEGVLGSTLPEAALWGQQLLSHVGPHETVGGVSAAPGSPEMGTALRPSSVAEGHDVSSLLGQNLAGQVLLGIDLGQ